MNLTRLKSSQTNNTKFEFLPGKTDRYVALYDWAIPLHADQQSGSLDLNYYRRPRSNLRSSPEIGNKMAGDGGGGGQMMMVTVCRSSRRS
jgi:hypothetical protein